MTQTHPIPHEIRQELAVLVHRFRRQVNGPRWDIPGIRAALDQCGEPACETAAAVFALAADPNIRTPGMLRHPGKHWPTVGGEQTTPQTRHTTTCHRHTTEPVPCRDCRAEHEADPPSPETIAAAKAAARKAKSPR